MPERHGDGPRPLSSRTVRSPMKTRSIVLIVLIVVIASVGTVFLTASDDRPDVPSGWDFPEEIASEDRDYPAADVARADFEKQVDATATVLSDPDASSDAIIGSIDALAEDCLRIRDWYCWASKDYHLDTVTYAQAYLDWKELTTDASDSYFATVKDGLNGPCGPAVESALETAGVDPDTYRGYDEMPDEEKALMSRAAELETLYDSVMNETYTAQTEQFTAAAEIYIELVRVNNSIAQLNGYDSYAEYAYSDIYTRDYTPKDAEGLNSLLGPATAAFFSVLDLMDSDITYSSSTLEWMDSLTPDQMVSTVRSYTDTIADRYSDLMQYLLDEDLIFINEQTENGFIGYAYTMDLILEGSAYILINGYHGYDCVSTIAHEFGHASNLCLNRDHTSCLDVKEIHSNGMEALLATSGASSLDGCGRAMSAEFLCSAFSTVITGILYTELELYAYGTEAETGALTVSMLEAKFNSLLKAAGLSFGSECDGLVWTKVPHLFNRPMYYISYVTSSIDALDLFVDAVHDHDEAEERYVSLVGQRGVEGYVEAVERAGLVNAFDIPAAKRMITGSLDALMLVEA